jgi:uncharacterized membrane protein
MPSSPRISPAALLLAGVAAAYPFLVYAALGRVPPGALIVVALAVVGGRMAAARRANSAGVLLPALAGVFAATGVLALLDADAAVLAYPVLMNLGFAAAFGLSLLKPPTLVESLASLRHPNPSPAGRLYMRRVTVVWFVFLLGNATVSAATAVHGDMALWTLYNGLVAYLLMGLLFAVEFLVRRRVQGRAA